MMSCSHVGMQEHVVIYIYNEMIMINDCLYVEIEIYLMKSTQGLEGSIHSRIL